MSSAFAVGSLGRLVRSSTKRARFTPTTTITSLRYASTSFRMPAMSPTMTEGGIASWKKSEGESFQAGDVLLEIETDKATIDVEAQDDGIVAKILSQDGATKVPVGQIIAILAEEGDDLSSIQIPTSIAPEGSSSTPATTTENKDDTYKEETMSVKPGPESKTVEAEGKSAKEGGMEQEVIGGKGHEIHHANGKTMFPSVMRLLSESNLSQSQIDKIKGSARHGMLTKGDVLFAMGKVQDPRGTASKLKATKYGVEGAKLNESTSTTPPAGPKEPELILDGAALRRLILGGLEKATKPTSPLSSVTNPLSKATSTSFSQNDFDDVLSPYASLFAKEKKPEIELPSIETLVQDKGRAVKKDEWEGLF